MEELLFNPDEGKTILKPEGTGEGYWIGAPSIYFDKDSRKFYLYVRIRNPRPKEKGVTPEDTHRGYKCQILESKNGKDFKIIWEMTKKQIGVKSIEGASIIKVDNLYHMFFSFETHARIPRWQIKKMTAIHPTEFGLNKVKPIDWDLPHLHRLSIKDPIIREFNGFYYLYIDYFRFWKKPWGSTALFTSYDGLKFSWQDDIFTNLKKCIWAKHLVRLTSIFEHNGQYFGYFDGANKGNDLCEELSGLCTGTSPRKLKILSLSHADFASKYGKRSCRYIYCHKHDEELCFFYEYTEKSGEHVLKMMKIKN